ncbi:MAG: ABC transporter ATP-binding protein [Terracidiphilus sp.]
MTDTILEIQNLTIRFHTRQGLLTAVNDLTLSMTRGRVLGLVGETGCGKTVLSRGLLRIEAPGRIEAGHIRYFGDKAQATALESLNPNGETIRRIRWKEIAMVFQEPSASFGPQHTIGFQIGEAMEVHGIAKGRELQMEVIRVLESVRMPRPEESAKQYPHQLSGGMCQRAMIAMALSCFPRILIADEPTTALDVSTESQILELLRERQAALGMSVLYISHNLGVVAQIAHDVAVMYLGRIVERAPVKTLFASPKHPYTQALLSSIPRVDRDCSDPLIVLSGGPPDPFTQSTGCSFFPRCANRMEGLCDKHAPVLGRLEDGSEVSCHLYSEGTHD